MDRADPKDLSVGDAVRWDASGGTAYGEVEAKETDGSISAEPDGPDMEGTSDDPAFGVRVYQPGEDGWEASDVLTVHRAGALTKIDSFPDERGDMKDEDENRMHRSATANASIRMASDGERTTVQVMTEDIARDGMVLQADGVDTEAYMRNPVVLWNHGMDPQRGAVPVARTVNMQRVDGGIRATVEWDDDEFSQEIKRKVKRGFLSAVSIGWHHKPSAVNVVEQGGRKVPVIEESDMTEFSFVSVPADTNALVVERSHATADLEAALERVLDRKIDSLRDAATAATPRTKPAPEATAPDADDVQRDDTPEHDLDRLVETIDRIIDRKLGRA